MTMTTGSGKEEMTALSCAALSASFFISEGLGGEETNNKKKKAGEKADGLPPQALLRTRLTFRRTRSKRTSVLQQLAGAFDGDERALQRSEVELQHSGHRVQVAFPLRQGILSCKGNQRRTAPHY